MKTLTAGSCCVLLLCMTPAFAATIYRCADQAGHLTFTRHGCPTHQSVLIEEASNQTPGSGKAVPLAKEKVTRKRASEALTIVGERDDGCGNLITASEKRSAMIAEQVLPGMTRADIESTFGAPDRITSRNGQVQYHYSGKARTRTVSFDQYGCVRGTR